MSEYAAETLETRPRLKAIDGGRTRWVTTVKRSLGALIANGADAVLWTLDKNLRALAARFDILFGACRGA